MPWKPTDVAGLQLWLPTAYSGGLWVESPVAGPGITHASTDGAMIGQVYDPSVSAHRVTAISTSARPTYRLSTGHGCGLAFDGSNNFLLVENSVSAFNFIHATTPTFSILFWIKTATFSRTILDSCTGTTARAGVGLYLNANATLNVVIVKASSGNAVLNANTTATVPSDTWTAVTITCNAGSVSVKIGSQTAESFSCAAGASVNAYAGLYIAATASTYASKLNGSLADLAIYNTAVGASDLTEFRAFDPAATAVSLASRSDASSSITPDKLSHLRDWYDFGDTAWLWQEAAKTTPVAANNDPIGCVGNKTGATLNRDCSTATSANRPLYKTGVTGGRGAALFDGADDDLDMASGWAAGSSVTHFIVIKNTDDTYGSHYYYAGAPYSVVTGTNYSGNSVPPQTGSPYLVYHTSDTTNAIAAGDLVNATGFNIVEFVRDGETWSCWVNGREASAGFRNAGGFGPSNIGRHDGRPEWQMDGYICEIVHYTVVHSVADRKAVRDGLAAKWGVPNVGSPGRPGRPGLYSGGTL